jgi:hypothetical protein
MQRANPKPEQQNTEPITKQEWEEHYKDGWTKKYEKNLGANTGKITPIENFLLSNNVSRKEIKDYKDKVESGQIRIPEYDFSKINSRSLSNMSPEEFRKYLEQMNNYQASGKNFKVEIGDFGKSKE